MSQICHPTSLTSHLFFVIAKLTTSEVFPQSSLTYQFNVSLRHTSEDVRYAYPHIPKQAVSEETLSRIREQCNSPISLHLLGRDPSDTTAGSGFTLLSSAQLTQSDIGQSLQVEFSDITQQFQQWQRKGVESADLVEMRLVIRGSRSCQGSLTPYDLGFSHNANAYIVVFSSDDSEGEMMKTKLATLAADRLKRNAHGSGDIRGDDTEGGDDTEETNSADDSEPTSVTNNYHNRFCHLHHYSVRHGS